MTVATALRVPELMIKTTSWLMIIINSLNIVINSQQGNITPNTSGLSGKSFSATYSPKGKELTVTGIEDLPKISLGQNGERGAEEYFSDLLPLLPDAAVKIGDTWTTPIDKNVQQGQIALTTKGAATNVIEGIETLTKNTIQGSGTQMGQELNIKGVTKGTSTWYFAYKEGMLVKITNDEASNLKINMGNMEIPQTTESKTEIELVL